MNRFLAGACAVRLRQRRPDERLADPGGRLIGAASAGQAFQEAISDPTTRTQAATALAQALNDLEARSAGNRKEPNVTAPGPTESYPFDIGLPNGD